MHGALFWRKNFRRCSRIQEGQVLKVRSSGLPGSGQAEVVEPAVIQEAADTETEPAEVADVDAVAAGRDIEHSAVPVRVRIGASLAERKDVLGDLGDGRGHVVVSGQTVTKLLLVGLALRVGNDLKRHEIPPKLAGRVGRELLVPVPRVVRVETRLSRSLVEFAPLYDREWLVVELGEAEEREVRLGHGLALVEGRRAFQHILAPRECGNPLGETGVVQRSPVFRSEDPVAHDRPHDPKIGRYRCRVAFCHRNDLRKERFIMGKRCPEIAACTYSASSYDCFMY